MYFSSETEKVTSKLVCFVEHKIKASDDHPLGTMDLALYWTVCTTNNNRLIELYFSC